MKKIILILALIPYLLISNDIKDSSNRNSNIINYNGSLSLNTEYTSNSRDKELQYIRNQYTNPFNFRGNALLNISIYDQIELPFEFWFTTSQVGFQQPFNQFGVNPRIGNWLTLHAGYFFSNYSELSFGDSRVFGGGFDVNFDFFKLSALYGRLKEFRNNDSINNSIGTFQRMVYALKLGLGISNDFFVNLNVVKSWDDTTKKLSFRSDVLPKDNLVTSLSFGIPVFSFAKFSAEGAVSVFSNDIYSQEYLNEDIPSFVENIFTPRYSTQIDGSAKASLTLTPVRNYSFKFNAKWIGPGFQTLGYPSLQNDVIDYTFAPNIRLLNGNLTFKGSIGYRENNLRSNKKNATTRLIGSLDIFSQINDNFNISAQYSNYGMKTTIKKEDIHLQNISEIFQINPNINFKAFDALNSIMLSYSYQDITDKSTRDTSLKQYITNNANLNYSISFENTLNLTTSLFYNSNKSDFSSTIYSFTETTGYLFLEKKLNVNFTFGVTAIEFTKTDLQLSIRLNTSYNIGKIGTFSLNLSNMNYRSDNSVNYYQSPGSYNEIMGTLSYAITF